MKKRIFMLPLMAGVLVLASCNKTETKSSYDLTVATPTGAPLVAAANTLEKVEFTKITDTTLIPTYFSANEKDIIFAPVNVGTKLYNAGKSTYKLASVITYGNLYFASQEDAFDEVFDLNNRDLVFFGEGTVNQAVVDYVLEQYEITPKSVEYLGNTKLTQTELLSNPNAIVLIAEPALSAAKINKSNIKSLSVQDLFEAKSGNKKFCQAGCFVSQDAIDNKNEEVKQYLKEVKASCALASKDANKLASVAFKLDESTPEAVLAKSIPGCNIGYNKATDIKEMFEFTCNLNLALFGNKLPDDDFYFNA